ncbi:hypothetical protein LBMAG51_12160 [Phycisphaerae bacterium]|nr:hypothetical protein LBMAG51_12160 [Phycisphaerae bacterium]
MMGIRLRDHSVALVSKLRTTERDALAALVSLQKNDGHFVGE